MIGGMQETRSSGNRPACPVRHGSLGFLFLVALAASAEAENADHLDIPIRGVVKAVNQASLSTDVAMRIARLPFREGQAFAKGDVLVEFDCRRQTAELQAVRGTVREAELNLASNVSLDRFQAVGKNDVEITRARLEKAQGELRALEARVQDCVVVAPFAGRISDVVVRELEFTVAQRPYLSIVEDSRMEIEMIIPSVLLAALSPGQPSSFNVDELPGTPVRATILHIGAVVDPVSKTAKIIAVVDASPPALMPGMSGTATFSQKAR